MDQFCTFVFFYTIISLLGVLTGFVQDLGLPSQ